MCRDDGEITLSAVNVYTHREVMGKNKPLWSPTHQLETSSYHAGITWAVTRPRTAHYNLIPCNRSEPQTDSTEEGEKL